MKNDMGLYFYQKIINRNKSANKPKLWYQVSHSHVGEIKLICDSAGKYFAMTL